METSLSVIGLPWVYNTSVIPVQRDKSITELHKSKSTIPIHVISLVEQVNLLLRWHKSKMIDEAGIKLRQCKTSTRHLIKYLEGVKEIEVCMHYKPQLALFNQSLLVDELHKSLEKILLDLILNKRFVDILHKWRLFLFGAKTKCLLNTSSLTLDSCAYWSFVCVPQLWSLVWLGVLGLGHV